MKNFVVLAGLIAAAATGCTSSSDAHVGAIWTIKSIVSGAEAGCPPGFDTAALYNQPIDANGNSVGPPIIDLFDCAAGAGTSAPLPPTAYETHVEITNHDNSSVYATSVPADLDVTDSDLTYSTDILVDGGYFAFAWSLNGAQSGTPLDCSSAGVDGSSSGIELIATISGGTASAADQFTCTDGSGVTAGYPAGNYTVSIDAFTSAGAVGTAAPINSSIQAPNKVTNLNTVTIPIDGK